MKTLVSDASDADEHTRETLRSQYQADALSTKMESINLSGLRTSSYWAHRQRKGIVGEQHSCCCYAMARLTARSSISGRRHASLDAVGGYSYHGYLGSAEGAANASSERDE